MQKLTLVIQQIEVVAEEMLYGGSGCNTLIFVQDNFFC